MRKTNKIEKKERVEKSTLKTGLGPEKEKKKEKREKREKEELG